MKYIGRDKDSIRAIEEVVNLLDKYGKNISNRLQDIIKSYIMSGIEAHDKEQMLLQVHSLAHKARRYDMVTLGEVLNEELRRIGHEEGLAIGRQEGRQEGKLEILKAIVTRLLTKHTDIATIQDITGATEAEIHQIANAND
ncbi:MAG: hypothetical protein CMF50_07140 [Legionellales bacterium]|nr:hypothetical protein [Legionellales bacterium]|tara:strand:- start:11464 stop:11886 length:423 start_codon:yes stop_codon:yes gene_type:complete